MPSGPPTTGQAPGFTSPPIPRPRTSSPQRPPLQLLLLDPLLVPHEHAGERRHQGRGMARTAVQPAPEAAEKDAARALGVEAAVELRDLLRAPHAQARPRPAPPPARRPAASAGTCRLPRGPPRVPGPEEPARAGADGGPQRPPNWPATNPSHGPAARSRRSSLSAATAEEASPLRGESVMAADAGMAPRPLRQALLGSGRRPVGPLAPRRPPAGAGGRDAGRAAERRRTAQAGQQADSRAFRDCHTRRPRAPYPVSAAWALIGRDLDSRVLIGVAKCSSLPSPALACNARSPPASKEGTVCGIARPKTPRVNSSQDQIQVASGNTRSGSRHQHPASGTRLPASCGQEVPLFSQQAVGGLEPREQSEAYTPASFLPCTCMAGAEEQSQP
ncbi:uncharacterized protein LOC114671862 [Macaca mulatta]